MKAYLPALVWGIVITYLSTAFAGINLPEELADLLAWDKLAHAFVYGIWTLLLIYGFNRNGWQHKWAIFTAVLMSAGYGTLMEFVQYKFFPGRHFEYFDMLANDVGAVLSLFWFKRVVRPMA